MRHPRGITLIEITLALGLIGLGIVFVVSIIPSSVLTLKRAEDLQAATAYGIRVLDEAQQSPPTTEGVDRDEHVTINATDFHVKRQVVKVDDSLMDVIVTVKWRDDVPPITLATRLPNALSAEEE